MRPSKPHRPARPGADSPWSPARSNRWPSKTAKATSEIAAQVSNEASETGRRAAEIRDGSAEIASKVDDLRATLVRVIRTSTTDVDRRLSNRVDIRRPATLWLQGKSGQVMVRDLSLGGAMIDEALPNATIGTPIRLKIVGIAVELSGVLARKTADAALVSFELSEEARRIVGELVAARQAA